VILSKHCLHRPYLLVTERMKSETRRIKIMSGKADLDVLIDSIIDFNLRPSVQQQ